MGSRELQPGSVIWHHGWAYVVVAALDASVLNHSDVVWYVLDARDREVRIENARALRDLQLYGDFTE